MSKAATQIGEPIYTNPLIQDVQKAFAAVDVTSPQTPPNTLIADVGSNGRVQGFAPWGGYFVATHDESGDSKGLVLVLNNKGLLIQEPTSHKDHNHPGGLQVIGDFAVIPVDKEASSTTPRQHSHDTFVDTYLLSKDGEFPSMTLVNSFHAGGEGGALGITSYTSSDGSNRYILCVFGDHEFKFFRSTSGKLGGPGFTFTPCGSYKNPAPHAPSGMGLATEDSATQAMYIVVFASDAHDLSYKDYVLLHSVDFESGVDSSVKSVTPISTRHAITKKGGPDGVHFCWGTGLKLIGPSSMQFYASQRDMTGRFTYNEFLAK